MKFKQEKPHNYYKQHLSWVNLEQRMYWLKAKIKVNVTFIQ